MTSIVDMLNITSPRPDHFRSCPEGEGPLLFGGLTASVVLATGARTVADSLGPKSLHLFYLKEGTWGPALDVDVERTADSSAFATRSVTVRQGENVVASAVATFHRPHEGRDFHVPGPQAPPPEGLTEHLGRFGSDLAPVVYRPVRPGALEDRNRVHPYWARAVDPGSDELGRLCDLAFLSDYWVLVSPFTPGTEEGSRATSRTLEHIVWFHRPVRNDDWLLYSCDPVSIVGGRYLSRGAVHDRDGIHIASIAQEGTIRLMPE